MRNDRTAYAISTSPRHYLTSVGEETVDVAQARIWYTEGKVAAKLAAVSVRFPEAAIVEVVVGSDRTGAVTINGFPRKPAVRKSAVKRRVWEKYGCKCAYCGADVTLRKCHMDRYYPDAGDDPSNLMPACDDCYCHKNGKTPGEFQKFLEQTFSQVRKHYLYRMARRYGMVVESPGWTFYYLRPEARALAEARATKGKGD